MRRITISIVLFILIYSVVFAGGSDESRVEHRSVISHALTDNDQPVMTEITVYLPPGYDKSRKDFPVIFLFNGIGGNNREFFTGGDWADYRGTTIDVIADNLIGNRDIEPVVIVGVQLTGLVAVSRDENTRPLPNYFFNEVVPFVETNYRIEKPRSARGLFGWSDGGGNAIELVFLHPEEFGILGLYSPWFGNEEWHDDPNEYVLDKYLDFDVWFDAYDADRHPLKIWIWFGENDENGSFPIGQRLGAGLEERGIKPRFETDFGNHWPTETNIINSLVFFSESL